MVLSTFSGRVVRVRVVGRRKEGSMRKSVMVKIRQQACLSLRGRFAQGLVVHVLERDIALVVKGCRWRWKQQSIDVSDGPVWRVTVRQKERRR